MLKGLKRSRKGKLPLWLWRDQTSSDKLGAHIDQLFKHMSEIFAKERASEERLNKLESLLPVGLLLFDSGAEGNLCFLLNTGLLLSPQSVAR